MVIVGAEIPLGGEVEQEAPLGHHERPHQPDDYACLYRHQIWGNSALIQCEKNILLG